MMVRLQVVPGRRAGTWTVGVLALEESSRNHPGTQYMIFLREPEQPQMPNRGAH